MPSAQRVLIAESDERLRRLLYRRLLEGDIFSDSAVDTPDALKHLGEGHYSLVLLDLGLQGDPDRIIDQLRALPARSRPMVLALAAREVSSVLDVDIVQIIVRKPFNVSELVALIRGCLSWNAGRKATQLASPGADEPRDSEPRDSEPRA